MLDVIRKRAVHAKALPLGLHWVMLVIAGVLFALVATFVDLRPVVDENFFFSTSDPGIQQTKKIEHQFPSQPEVILTVSSRDISSSRYLGRIQKLTQRVHSIGGASAVKSLAEGPKSFEDAIKSPFWSRLLIATDRKASNVIIFMKGRHTETPIRKLEQIVHELDAHDFRIHIAGPPYVVEMLRRSLEHDFRYFTLTAIVLFGLTMAVLFRSVRLFVGMLCTCASAVLLTLLLQSTLGHKIGILTVNLGTIVFIVALSHLVYMTFNWQTLADRAHRIGKESPDLARDARRMTFSPSLWSMVCASLGFASLLIVQAKPLRELGFGGLLGSVVAFACAYLMYPAFLRWAVPRKKQNCEGGTDARLLGAPFSAVVVRRYCARDRTGIRSNQSQYGPKPDGLFQAALGTARWLGIRGSHRWLEPAYASGLGVKWQQTEHRRSLPEKCGGSMPRWRMRKMLEL